MGKLRLLALSLITLLAIVSGVTLAATSVKSSKSNSSFRAVKVTEVDTQAKTFTVAVVFSAPALSKLPAAGDIIDVTYTITPNGQLEGITFNNSKSNTF